MIEKERQPGGGEETGDSGEPVEIGNEESAEELPEAAEAAEGATGEDEGALAEGEADGDAGEDVAELKDQLLRALAETENVRRRARKEVADASRYGIANFARDMLSVSDNMARALESVPGEAGEDSETLKALVEGVEMTAREMASALERHGIQQVNPLGEKFDYNLHQAMFEAPATGQPDGTIVEVVQAGYMIGERLLRPAMVGVAKGAGAAVEDDGEDNGSGEEAANIGAKLDTSA